MSNMYPDLNEDDQNKKQLADQHTPSGYQSTTTKTTTTKKKGEKKEKDSCCFLGAKIWVTLIGILSLLIGVFVVAISLYAKFAYAGYDALSETLPTGGIWMIFGFGLILTFCSVVLLLATCFYDLKCFKFVLVVFAIILSILLIMEIVSAAIMVWGLSIIALPEGTVTDALAEQLISARNKSVATAYIECCVDNRPPYDLNNVTKIDSLCLWPEGSDIVKQKCDGNVLECVCKSSTAYGHYFGLFLQNRLTWVGVVTIIFAILLLVGLVSTCILIFKSKKKSDAMYHSQQ